MSSTRRQFLQSTAAASLSPLPSTGAAPSALDAFQMARSHRIVREGPTPEFFEGMLLGNGDIGLCITVRPDALGLHIGKSDSWDIRVSEEQDAHVLSFEDFLKLWDRASAEAKRQGKPDMLYLERDIPFFREYTAKVTASYSKTWPRPWPCGSVWFHWDASRTTSRPADTRSIVRPLPVRSAAEWETDPPGGIRQYDDRRIVPMEQFGDRHQLSRILSES